MRAAITFALVLTLAGCKAAQTYKLATKFQESGSDYQAALTYLEVLEIKDTHRKAHEGLVAVSEDAYAQKLRIAQVQEEDKNYPAALTEYRELQALLKELKFYRAKNFATVNVFDKIEAMESSAAEERYQAGDKALAGRQWGEAIKQYQAALAINAGYKDARQKTGQAHYLWGEEELKAHRWRSGAKQFKAGWSFNHKESSERGAEVYAALGRYFLAEGECRQATTDLRIAVKLNPQIDVSEPLTEAEGCAILPVAVLPIENATGTAQLAGTDLGASLAGRITQKLREDSSEFLRILERDALAGITTEQAISGSSATSGARYLIVGNFTQILLQQKPVSPARRTAPGRQPYSCTKRRSDGSSYQATCQRNVTVAFLEYQGSVQLTAAGSIRAVDTRTSERTAATNFNKVVSDTVHYANSFTVGGQPVPIQNDARAVSLESSILKLGRQKKQTLKDENALVAELLDAIAGKVSSDVLGAIDAYKPPRDPVELALK